MGLLSSKLSAGEMAIICRQLAVMYNAGIPILGALSLVAEQRPGTKGYRFLSAMSALIADGASLGEAARAESNVLPDLFVEVMSAAEKGGRLDVLLRDLADHYERIHEMKRAVIVSLIYPGLQLVAAWFLGTFALGIARSIGNIYDGSGGRFSMSAYLSAYAWFQVAVVGLLFLGAVILAVPARLGWLHGVATLAKNSIWPLNRISQKFALARFYRGMALLVQAGLDMKQCIARSAAMTMNPPMERDLKKAVPVVGRGGTLVEAFSASRYLSRVGREMLAIGEQTGDLDVALQKAAEYSFEEGRAAVTSAAKVLQVLITVVVGCIVGYFVISFYGNLYKL